MKSILIVDDHPGFRASARRLLQAEGYAVIGEAADAASGLLAARELRPAVVLLDVNLPDRNGISLVASLLELAPAPDVVLVSSHTGHDFGALIAASGARGFVPKAELSGTALEELLA